MKFLVTFLRSCYGGRASDKFITKDSDFYDPLERDDVVMADCGFQIKDDLLLHFVIYKYLQVHGERFKKRGTKEKRNCKFTNSR